MALCISPDQGGKKKGHTYTTKMQGRALPSVGLKPRLSLAYIFCSPETGVETQDSVQCSVMMISLEQEQSNYTVQTGSTPDSAWSIPEGHVNTTAVSTGAQKCFLHGKVTHRCGFVEQLRKVKQRRQTSLLPHSEQ